MKTIPSEHFGEWALKRNGLQQHNLSPKDFITQFVKTYGCTRAQARANVKRLLRVECWYDIKGKYKVARAECKPEDGLIHNSYFEGTTWLCIRNLKDARTRDWQEYQWIKNDFCGPEREGIEIYPAESRLHDTDDVYNLFVLPEGIQMPIGWNIRTVEAPEYGMVDLRSPYVHGRKKKHDSPSVNKDSQ